MKMYDEILSDIDKLLNDYDWQLVSGKATEKLSRETVENIKNQINRYEKIQIHQRG